MKYKSSLLILQIFQNTIHTKNDPFEEFDYKNENNIHEEDLYSYDENLSDLKKKHDKEKIEDTSILVCSALVTKARKLHGEFVNEFNRFFKERGIYDHMEKINYADKFMLLRLQTCMKKAEQKGYPYLQHLTMELYKQDKYKLSIKSKKMQENDFEKTKNEENFFDFDLIKHEIEIFNISDSKMSEQELKLHLKIKEIHKKVGRNTNRSFQKPKTLRTVTPTYFILLIMIITFIILIYICIRNHLSDNPEKQLKREIKILQEKLVNTEKNLIKKINLLNEN